MLFGLASISRVITVFLLFPHAGWQQKRRCGDRRVGRPSPFFFFCYCFVPHVFPTRHSLRYFPLLVLFFFSFFFFFFFLSFFPSLLLCFPLRLTRQRAQRHTGVAGGAGGLVMRCVQARW